MILIMGKHKLKKPVSKAALVNAAFQGDVPLMRTLLDRVEKDRVRYSNVLEEMYTLAEVKTVKLLLAREARIQKGVGRALDIAAKEGHLKVVELLLKREVFTPFALNQATQSAVAGYHCGIVKLLAEKKETER